MRIQTLLAAIAPVLACAQTVTVAPPAGTLGKGAETLYGPFIQAAVEVKSGDGTITPFAQRGLLVRTGDGWLCYANDSATGFDFREWSKPELDLKKTNLGTYKGVGTGAIVVSGGTGAGGGGADLGTRKRWRGFYVHGAKVITCAEYNGVARYEVLGPQMQMDLRQEDVRDLIKGGPANWPQTITVAGRRAADDAAYVVDTIPLPEDNPWKCWLRPTGLDFLPDGRLAVCTLGGDVWIASGLDDSLEEVTWRRFAGGLREPMGLRVVEGKIHVGCRDQITRLHDLNNDGEADFYECLNDGRTLVPNFHAFAYDLQTDSAGNFYYGTGGNQLGENEPWHGPLFRVSADGGKLDAIARGFRAPNGITVGPDNAIYVAENQGQWIPSSKISRVREGGFYGFVADPKAAPKAKVPATFDPPLCWLPHTWDNSSGGGVFCESERWGPFRGRMLHTSFGAASLFAVFEQRAGEVSQGGVVKFPLPQFESGIHRARFGPDGQLYVCGVKGWQSRAVRDGCLARVRYTGQPVLMPTGLRVEKDALVIEFGVPLDEAAAADPQNYAVQQWNYKWHATYGSPDISVANPKKTGRDNVDIGAVTPGADGRSVRIEVPGLAPVMQMLIKANLKTADGQPLSFEIANTINFIP